MRYHKAVAIHKVEADFIAETSQTNKNAGHVDFDGLVAQVGQQPNTTRRPQPDRLPLHDLPSHQRGAVRRLVQRAGGVVSVPVR